MFYAMTLPFPDDILEGSDDEMEHENVQGELSSLQAKWSDEDD